MYKTILLLPLLAAFHNAYTMESAKKLEQWLALGACQVTYDLSIRALFFKKTKQIDNYQATLKKLAQGCSLNLINRNNLFYEPQFSNILSLLQNAYLQAEYKRASLQHSPKQTRTALIQALSTAQKWKKKYFDHAHALQIKKRLASLQVASKQRRLIIKYQGKIIGIRTLPRKSSKKSYHNQHTRKKNRPVHTRKKVSCTK